MANQRKMTLRPAQQSADVDDLLGNLIAGADPVSAAADTEAPSEPVPVKRKPKAKPPAKPKMKVGRPPKAGEKRTHRLTVCFTETERAKLRERAGMVAEGTYLLAFLREHGLFD